MITEQAILAKVAESGFGLTLMTQYAHKIANGDEEMQVAIAEQAGAAIAHNDAVTFMTASDVVALAVMLAMQFNDGDVEAGRKVGETMASLIALHANTHTCE